MTVEEEMKIMEEINKESIKKCRLLYSYEIKEILDRFIIADGKRPRSYTVCKGEIINEQEI